MGAKAYKIVINNRIVNENGIIFCRGPQELQVLVSFGYKMDTATRMHYASEKD